MACTHPAVSQPVAVSLCLDNQEIECCGLSEEQQQIVVCRDCGAYKIVSVDRVCTDCCNNDTSIWDSYIGTWHEGAGDGNWDGTNLDFDLTVESSQYPTFVNYKNALGSSTGRKQIMVPGFYYTITTDPLTVDGCRLATDYDPGSISGTVWYAPTEATVTELGSANNYSLKLKGIRRFFAQK